MAEASARSDAGPSSGSGRLAQVDVLRGLAALTVVFGHYIPYWDRYVEPIPVLVPGSAGNYSVRLFYAISGLVIFLTLSKCRTVLDFAVLRFSRLYPTYWATLLIATLGIVLLFDTEIWWTGFAVNFSMIQEFLRVGNMDNVYWSLTVELAFYLNVAWLFALGLHRYPLRSVTVWLCLSALWSLFAVEPRESPRDWLALLLALDWSPYFAIGIVFYQTLGRAWRAGEATVIVLALAVELLIGGLEGVLVAVAVVLLMFGATRGHLTLLVCRPTLWLGSVSYALYLIHRNLGYHALSWFGEHGLGPVSAIAITALATLVGAGLVTALVERPASRFIRDRYRSLRRSPGLKLASS